MDKNEHDHVEDEQVEDLDTPESEAEEVKGGYSWGVSNPGIKGELGASKIGVKDEPGGIKQLGGLKQGLDGFTSNHNETLIAI